VSGLIRLYPRGWRDRYETEFRDLLSERRPTVAERFDIIRGALDAHLDPQMPRNVEAAAVSPMRGEDVRLARRLGMAAVIGGAIWPAAWGVASIGPIQYDGAGAYRDGSAAMPLLLIAVALLAAGLLGQYIRLPVEARVARGSALLAIPFVILFGLAPWMLGFVLVAIGLLVVLAVAGWHSGVWPLAASLVVTAACLGVVAVAGYAMTTFGGDRMAGGALMAVAAAVFIPVWLGVGATLIRRPSPA
jgi:hypothetical protein